MLFWMFNDKLLLQVLAELCEIKGNDAERPFCVLVSFILSVFPTYKTYNCSYHNILLLLFSNNQFQPYINYHLGLFEEKNIYDFNEKEIRKLATKNKIAPFILLTSWYFYLILFFFLQLTSLPNFLPDAMSDAGGREIQKLSFLGPFLQFSVFASDDVSHHIHISHKKMSLNSRLGSLLSFVSVEFFIGKIILQ